MKITFLEEKHIRSIMWPDDVKIVWISIHLKVCGGNWRKWSMTRLQPPSWSGNSNQRKLESDWWRGRFSSLSFIFLKVSASFGKSTIFTVIDFFPSYFKMQPYLYLEDEKTLYISAVMCYVQFCYVTVNFIETFLNGAELVWLTVM